MGFAQKIAIININETVTPLELSRLYLDVHTRLIYVIEASRGPLQICMYVHICIYMYKYIQNISVS